MTGGPLLVDAGHMRSIRASEFSANCLAILDEVSRTGESVIILKRGKPVASLQPTSKGNAKPPQLNLKGFFEIVGEIVAPAVPAEDWEVLLAVDEVRLKVSPVVRGGDPARSGSVSSLRCGRSRSRRDRR